MAMSEVSDDSPFALRLDVKGDLCRHTCGVVDDREASMLKHQIMSEIRKSNAPIWVAEELEKKLDCKGCWLTLRRRLLAAMP